jgi:hypothetical protein
VPAGAAPGSHVEDGPLARLDVGHPGPDRLDDAGALVAEHDGQRMGPFAVGLADVGVADPGAHDPDEHLAAAGVPQLEPLDALRLAECTQDGGPRRHGTGS